MNKNKPVFIGGVTIAVLVAFYLTWLFLTPFPAVFDANRWRTCTDHSERFAMHADFLRKHQFVGMSRSELITLLGPPDGRADDPEIEWDMGSIPGYDDNALRFNLKDDKVVSFSVFRM